MPFNARAVLDGEVDYDSFSKLAEVELLASDGAPERK